MSGPIQRCHKADGFGRLRRIAKESCLTALSLARAESRSAENCIRRVDHLPAIGMERVECTRPGKAFEGPLVDEPRINASRKIRKTREWAALHSDRDDVIHRLAPDPLHGRESVEDHPGL